MGHGRSHGQSHRPAGEVAAPMLSAPQPLAAHHPLAGFDSGEPLLDDWLKRRAGSQHWYCLAAGATGHAEAPPTVKRKRPGPVPVLVLGRLAIHEDNHQEGIGTALLNDAIRRAIQAGDIAGVTALLVQAMPEQARRFYGSRGFIESPGTPMTLCLMLATAEQALREPWWPGQPRSGVDQEIVRRLAIGKSFLEPARALPIAGPGVPCAVAILWRIGRLGCFGRFRRFGRFGLHLGLGSLALRGAPRLRLSGRSRIGAGLAKNIVCGQAVVANGHPDALDHGGDFSGPCRHRLSLQLGDHFLNL